MNFVWIQIKKRFLRDRELHLLVSCHVRQSFASTWTHVQKSKTATCEQQQMLKYMKRCFCLYVIGHLEPHPGQCWFDFMFDNEFCCHLHVKLKESNQCASIHKRNKEICTVYKCVFFLMNPTVSVSLILKSFVSVSVLKRKDRTVKMC